LLVSSACVLAQDLAQDAGEDAQTPQGQAQQEPDSGDGRVMGVIPNNKIVPSSKPEDTPLSIGGKFNLAFKDSVDPFTVVVSAFYAGIAQWQDNYPSYGLGASGYGKRFGAAYADQVVENYMTEAVFPSMLHQDPRYFRKGSGSWRSRVGYALTRTLITRKDDGGRAVNYSELVGCAAAAGISNFYYPASDRTAGETGEKFALQIVSDSGFNVLIEFWPDLRQKFLHRKP
jgi:hypothetical protein